LSSPRLPFDRHRRFGHRRHQASAILRPRFA